MRHINDNAIILSEQIAEPANESVVASMSEQISLPNICCTRICNHGRMSKNLFSLFNKQSSMKMSKNNSVITNNNRSVTKPNFYKRQTGWFVK
jgi:hypothetical protein